MKTNQLTNHTSKPTTQKHNKYRWIKIKTSYNSHQQTNNLIDTKSQWKYGEKEKQPVDQNLRERERERESLIGVLWPLAGSVGERDRGRAVAMRSQEWGDGRITSSGGIASKRPRRRWDREPLRWDGERLRPWFADVRSRRKWDREVRNRESERLRPRCRRWDHEKLEVRSWEAEGENVRVRDREAKWEREKWREDWGVRREGWKWKKLVLGEGKKNKNNVVLE